jgi:uncharacterized membrane protein
VVEQLRSAPSKLLEVPEYAFRFLRPHRGLSSAFGDDAFGQFAERLARFFGTPRYIFGQTVVVIVWIIFNGYAIFVHFDPYPFILLNLAFSTQAAYAAPLILLAQTRQAERDKVLAEADAAHREQLAQHSLERQAHAEHQTAALTKLLEQNTELTEQTKQLAEQIDVLTNELHKHIVQGD